MMTGVGVVALKGVRQEGHTVRVMAEGSPDPQMTSDTASALIRFAYGRLPVALSRRLHHDPGWTWREAKVPARGNRQQEGSKSAPRGMTSGASVLGTRPRLGSVYLTVHDEIIIGASMRAPAHTSEQYLLNPFPGRAGVAPCASIYVLTVSSA